MSQLNQSAKSSKSASICDEARVWIYQADRPLTAAEQALVEARLTAFLAGWAAHGRALAAAGEVRHGQFIIIALDERVAGASGCSIDASVNFLRGLEAKLGVRLLDKSRMAFEVEAGVPPRLLTRAELRAAIAAGEVGPATPYFDNTVGTKGELDRRWPAPAGQTWLASFFAGVPAGGH